MTSKKSNLLFCTGVIFLVLLSLSVQLVRRDVAQRGICARRCGQARVLVCTKVGDPTWAKPQLVAVCLTPEGVRTTLD